MTAGPGHVVLLGGLGGDSHSVGLALLRWALRASGYRVAYLGIQNSVAEFVANAYVANAVFVSSMDGHAAYYLQDLPRLRSAAPASAKWYIGGNLVVGDALGAERTFLALGFDRVFVKFVDIETVLTLLRTDLLDATPTPVSLNDWHPFPSTTNALLPSDERRSPQLQALERAEVLGQWPTGDAAWDLQANARFLCRQKSFASTQARVVPGRPLIQPRCGVTLPAPQLRLFQALRDAGANVLSYQVDSFTRNGDHVRAADAIRDSRRSRVATTNGFPVVNHGVPELRRIAQMLRVPLQVRHSTRDPRLLAEISLAGGVTAFEGGAICYNLPYYRDYPLSISIHRWQYVDRLVGEYLERFGILIDREFFGTLTGTLIPPSLAIATDLLEALLAAQQGVRAVSLGYAEQGCRSQDVAAIRAMRSLAHSWLRAAGFANVAISTVFHQYMAAFPTDPRRAEQLIIESAQTAVRSEATRVLTKTATEAVRIPSARENVAALKLVRAVRDQACRQPEREAAIQCERAMIEREVTQLLDGVLVCGRGNVARGVIEAFARGMLDIPFAPSIHNRGEVLTARDDDGAVRYASFGRLPFDTETRQFHQDRISERRRRQGLHARPLHELTARDVLQVPRGEFQQWPLGA
jgi:methylaspartate mutase E subunit/methylaspartate mutase S subunit